MLTPKVSPRVLLEVAVVMPNHINPSEPQKCLEVLGFCLFVFVAFFLRALSVAGPLQNSHEHLPDLVQLCSLGQANLGNRKSEYRLLARG